MKKNVLYFVIAILNFGIIYSVFAAPPSAKPIKIQKAPPRLKPMTVTRPETAPVLTAEKSSIQSGERSLLKWTPVAVSVRYDFEHAADAAFTKDIITVEKTGTELDFGGVDLPQTRIYYIHVRARNDDGSGPWSNVVKVTIEASPQAAQQANQQPPAAPELSASSLIVLSDQTYTITWDKAPDAKRIGYQEAIDVSFGVNGSSGGTSNSSLSFHHEVNKPTTYYYHVRVEESGRPYSAWSNTVGITINPRSK